MDFVHRAHHGLAGQDTLALPLLGGFLGLIGVPLAYQYQTTLRGDSLPGTQTADVFNGDYTGPNYSNYGRCSGG